MAEPTEDDVVQVSLPAVLLELQGVDIDITPLPDGGQALVIGPMLMKIALPLDAAAAAAVAAELTKTRVLVAPASALGELKA